MKCSLRLVFVRITEVHRAGPVSKPYEWELRGAVVGAET